MASTQPGLLDHPARGRQLQLSSTTELASAVAATGAAVTALDIVESSHDAIVVDVTCNTIDEEHAARDLAMP